MSGVYFPNAFTPNNDGMNDLFKAQVFGTLKSFSLNIYDRFGQRVFQTNDCNTGWNGRFNKADLSPGTFVWCSEYRFNNDVLKTQKGTVILIR